MPTDEREAITGAYRAGLQHGEESATARAKAELEATKKVLGYLADPENWLGDPHDIHTTLHGHFTPYELARRALEGSDDG